MSCRQLSRRPYQGHLLWRDNIQMPTDMTQSRVNVARRSDWRLLMPHMRLPTTFVPFVLLAIVSMACGRGAVPSSALRQQSPPHKAVLQHDGCPPADQVAASV